MKALLILLLLAALGGGGYEYYIHLQQADLYVQQRATLTEDMARLKKQNKDLADETAILTDKLTGLQNQAADLRAQLNTVQGVTNAPPAPAPAPVPTP